MSLAEALPIAVPRVVTRPYPGLRPFFEEEQSIFFGRERHVDEVVDALEAKGFVAVVGESGLGKSSLVYAGLVPSLRSGALPVAGLDWTVVTMRPGNDPQDALARALCAKAPTRDALGVSGQDAESVRQAKARFESPFGLTETLRQARSQSRTALLLIVDQFEEIFRYRSYPDPFGPIKFVDSLTKALQNTGDGVYVVLTMRSDYLGDCARFADLAERINESSFLTPRLTREEQRMVIELPLRRFDAAIEAELVNVLLNEKVKDGRDRQDPAEEGPDKLPLMQHALQQLWEAATERTKGEQEGALPRLMLKDFEQLAKPRPIRTAPNHRSGRSVIGQIEGPLQQILDNHCEEVYESVVKSNEERRRVVERLFKSLTNRDRGKQDSRREVQPGEVVRMLDPRSSTSSNDRCANLVLELINPFRVEGCNFIMPAESQVKTLTQTTPIDLVHESLIRRWKRLSKWADEELNAITEYQRLVRYSRRWSERQVGVDPMGASLYRECRNWVRVERDQKLAWALHFTAGTNLTEDEAKKDFEGVIRYIRWSGFKVKVLPGVLSVVLIILLLAITLSTNQLGEANKKLSQANSETSAARTAAIAAAEKATQASALTASAEKRLSSVMRSLGTAQADENVAKVASENEKKKLSKITLTLAQEKHKVAALVASRFTIQEQLKDETDAYHRAKAKVRDLSADEKQVAKSYKSLVGDYNRLSALKAQLQANESNMLDQLQTASVERDGLRSQLVYVIQGLDGLLNKTPQAQTALDQIHSVLTRIDTLHSPSNRFTLTISSKDSSAILSSGSNAPIQLGTKNATGVAEFSPRENWLGVSTKDFTVVIYAISADGKATYADKISGADVLQIAFSVLNDWVAVLMRDGTVRVRKVGQPKSEATVAAPKDQYVYIVFADDDGKQLILRTTNGKSFRWSTGADPK